MEDSNILRFTWRHSRRAQLWILFVVLASMPTYFLALDLPKQIVNGPILGKGFDQPDTIKPFLALHFSLFGREISLFDGFALDRMGMLFALSGAFLALIIVNGLFKFYINTYKGRLGERMLRRIRFQLIDRMLRFPVRHFRRVKPSEMASMVKEEVEPIGGFMGDAFVQPLLLGGQALTAIIFILIQNVWLGMIAVSMIIVQFMVIPRMRRHLVRLGKLRQLKARQLSGRVAEIVDGITHIHVNDTSHFERAEISSRLSTIFDIRYELFRRKFFTKFLNNLLSHFTPFLFYVIGGYFALQGKIDVGQLVAVIAAYKDLPSPIKELIDWEQRRVDVEVKFAQVVENFDVDNMLDKSLQCLPDGPVPPLPFPVEARNLTVSDDAGNVLVERVRLTVNKGDTVALLGPVNCGADALADTLVRLHIPEAGQVSYGGTDVFALSESLLGRRIGYASGDVFLPQGRLRDALLYALKHQPVAEATDDGGLAAARHRYVLEARETANSELDITASWVGMATDDLRKLLVSTLEASLLKDDVFMLGLRGKVDEARQPGLQERILAARGQLRARLDQLKLSGLIEPFDPGLYASQATVGENLLFGTPVGDTFQADNMLDNGYLRGVLSGTGLEPLLVDKGVALADTTIALFQDLPPEHELFDELTFMDADLLPTYQGLMRKVKQHGQDALKQDERNMLIGLMFGYAEPRHRMGLVDDALRDKVLEARRRFREGLPAEFAGAIRFHDPATYNAAASVQDNLLMGRLAYGMARGPERVLAAISTLLDELGLSEDILEIGLDFDVGPGGKRLSTAQRQKVGLCRALLKQPDLLVLNRVVSAQDMRQQAAIVGNVMRLVEAREDRPAVIWVLAHAGLASHFDTVCVFNGGKLAEQGPRMSLEGNGGVYAKLLESQAGGYR